MALPRIRLPNIPADVVPYAITPDAHTARAGFGFGGRSSMDRQDEYRDMLIQRGYNPSDAKELAWLEERQAWADRAEENRPPETRTRAQLASQNFSPTEIDRILGRPTNVEANLAAAATPITLEPVAGARDPDQTAYNAETFAEGYGFDDSGNPAYLGKVDIDKPSERELVDRGRRAYNARDPRGAEVAAAGGQIYGDYVPSDEVAQPLGMTAPGPRTLDGRPTAMPKPLMTPEDVEAYDVRKPGGLSQRDEAMAQRGYVPVVTPDGVSYMLAYVPSRPQNDGYQIPGMPGMAGPRPDLEGRYEPKTMVGPDGNPVQVWAPGPAMREKKAADLKGRQAAYQDKKKGMDEDREEAKKMWRATAMLAGGSQNINSGNRGMYNQLAMMDDANRERALLYMSPAGRLAAEVDARNAEMSGRMAQQAMTAFLANNPGADPEARKRAEDQILREKNPAGAGAQDIAGGNTSSTEAMKEFARLSESLDNTALGFSYDNERALAETLQKPPYNMSQAEAEAKAYEYAEKRRWVTGGGPGGVRPPTPEGLEDVYPSGAM